MFIVTNLNKFYQFSLLNLQRIIGAFLLITIVVFPSQAQNTNNGIKKIVIDPGHGGKDPGNLGTGRYKETEKHIALDISLIFGKYVKSHVLCSQKEAQKSANTVFCSVICSSALLQGGPGERQYRIL